MADHQHDAISVLYYIYGTTELHYVSIQYILETIKLIFLANHLLQ